METQVVREALSEVREDELDRLGRVATRLLAGCPSRSGGPHATWRSAARGFEFLEYRPYAPGDDLRGIDWRASARLRRPQVRRFVDDASSRWFVCLDHSGSMGTCSGAKWLLGLQLAAAWAYLLLRNGHSVGLLLFSDRIAACCPPGRGRSQYHRIMDHLVSAPPPASGRGTSLSVCAGWLGRPSNAAVISDFLAPDALTADLDQLLLAGSRVQALQVLSAQECGALPDAPAMLRDVETGERRPVQTAAGASAGAVLRLKSLQQHLDDYCRGGRIPLTACLTGQTWREVLLRHLTSQGEARD